MSAPVTTDVDLAATTIRGGGLVAFATETVYGLGADAGNPTAVARVFAAKERPFFDPLIVHVAAWEQVHQIAADWDAGAGARLARRFWPGPLTLVAPRHPAVPDIVAAGLPTVGIRWPAHWQARQLIERAGCPIAAPSANLFGRVSPTTAAHVAEQLGDRIDLILDGGACRVGIESTVLDMTTRPFAVLRLGGTTVEALESEIGVVTTGTTVPPGESVRSPGLLARHYAPGTPLRFWNPLRDEVPAGRIGILSLRGVECPERFDVVEVLSPDGDLTEAAAGLFAALRRLDARGLDLILAEPTPETGLGRAINDRLRRAAAAG